jgi:uncharacterized cupredoxin-like copper-binding protein
VTIRTHARAFLLRMREGDGKMLFSREKLEIKRGEQIRFIITNDGELEHEFVLAMRDENVKHAEQMKTNPEMEPRSQRQTRRSEEEE